MDDPVIGQIYLFGFNFPPRNTASCAGQLLSIPTNTALFSLLGTFYGGDGRQSFGLPDLRGRVAVNQGQGLGSSISWHMGQTFGSEQQYLTQTQLPTHNHNAQFVPGGGSVNVTVDISSDQGTTPTPTSGCYLANVVAGGSGPDKPELIYRPDAGSGTLPMGGVSASGTMTGSVTIDNTGASQPFWLLQPTLGLNYSIAQTGLYPSRN